MPKGGWPLVPRGQPGSAHRRLIIPIRPNRNEAGGKPDSGTRCQQRVFEVMRFGPVLLCVVFLPLANCAHLDKAGRSYAGSPGSTYNTALNPPQANGVVTYDPSIPIAAHDYGNSGGGYLAAAPGP